jgi:hypothetical protein
MIEHSLLEAARELRARGDEMIVATVVRARDSADRRPGARMLIARDRWIAGSVGAGCLERDILRRAWSLTEREPALVTYDASGVIDILLERTSEPFALVDEWLAAPRRGAIATIFAPTVRHVALDEDGKLHGDANLTLRCALSAAVANDGAWSCQFDCEDMLIESICRP